MFIDDETRYWQEAYRNGELDDEDMPGEIRALLDGTAESMFAGMFRMFVCFILGIIPVAVMGWYQNHRPVLYSQFQENLRAAGLDFGTGWDPTLFIMFACGILATVLYFVTGRKRDG